MEGYWLYNDKIKRLYYLNTVIPIFNGRKLHKNERQKLLLQNLKNIKDYWTKTAVDGLNPNTDLIWSDYEEEYKILQTKLTSQEELNAFYSSK